MSHCPCTCYRKFDMLLPPPMPSSPRLLWNPALPFPGTATLNPAFNPLLLSQPALAQDRLTLTTLAPVEAPSQPLPVGAIAPDFILNDQNGQPVRLYDALRQGSVVLFFYPKDNSPLCSKQVQAFRDAYPALQQLGASVFGISSDSAKSHQQFIANQQLNFPLLSDPDQQVRTQYGAQTLGFLPGRVTFVIDSPTRRIRASYSSQANIAEHIRTAITALQPQTIGNQFSYY